MKPLKLFYMLFGRRGKMNENRHILPLSPLCSSNFCKTVGKQVQFSTVLVSLRQANAHNHFKHFYTTK